MRSKVGLIAVAAAILCAASSTAFSQAEPSAIGPGGRPLSVGVGFSINFLDYSPSSQMEGIAAWADWNCFRSPGWLSRAAIDVEGRDVNWGRPESLPTLRVDTIQGGIKYRILQGSRFGFYAKGLGGIGSMDVPPGDLSFTHKTQEIFSFGEGVNMRLNRSFTLNFDGETQVWLKFFDHGGNLTPTALTVGIFYTFGRRDRGQRVDFGN